MNNEFLGKITKDKNFYFKDNTTYRLGGKSVCYYPKNREEVIYLLNYCQNTITPYFILGNGSNVLASDKGFDGLVISTKYLNKICLLDKNLYCEAGVTVGMLLRFLKENSLGGLEYLAGIPATIGGLVYMNGGAFNTYIGKDIVWCETANKEKTTKHSREWCDFGYKHSTMSDINAFIYGVGLKIEPTSRQVIVDKIKSTIEKRMKNPKGRSCGCVFKNFDSISAGEVIEKAALKGKRLGGAYVSELHANFILNDGGTSSDVYNLIEYVKREVYRMFGIQLVEEVKYIGEFNETDR